MPLLQRVPQDGRSLRLLLFVSMLVTVAAETNAGEGAPENQTTLFGDTSSGTAALLVDDEQSGESRLVSYEYTPLPPSRPRGVLAATRAALQQILSPEDIATGHNHQAAYSIPHVTEVPPTITERRGPDDFDASIPTHHRSLESSIFAVDGCCPTCDECSGCDRLATHPWRPSSVCRRIHGKWLQCAQFLRTPIVYLLRDQRRRWTVHHQHYGKKLLHPVRPPYHQPTWGYYPTLWRRFPTVDCHEVHPAIIEPHDVFVEPEIPLQHQGPSLMPAPSKPPVISPEPDSGLEPPGLDEPGADPQAALPIEWMRAPSRMKEPAPEIDGSPATARTVGPAPRRVSDPPKRRDVPPEPPTSGKGSPQLAVEKEDPAGVYSITDGELPY